MAGIPLTRAELGHLYLTQQKSATQIGMLYGCSRDVVYRWLRKYKITLRSKSEATKLAMSYRRHRVAKCPVKSELVCRKCGAFWKHTTGRAATCCPYCGTVKSARDRRHDSEKRNNAPERKAKMIEWSKDTVNRKKRAAASRLLLRKRVFFRVCGSIHPKCVRCGCDDFRLLEVNHKNGGGVKELRRKYGKGPARFYVAVASGQRKTDDLELLCKPCNAIHFLEMKYGPLPMRVVWSVTTVLKPQ